MTWFYKGLSRVTTLTMFGVLQYFIVRLHSIIVVTVVVVGPCKINVKTFIRLKGLPSSFSFRGKNW